MNIYSMFSQATHRAERLVVVMVHITGSTHYNLIPISVCIDLLITGYSSILYVGIAMVFVFSPYIFFYFQFNDFTAQHMSKPRCVPFFTEIPLLAKSTSFPFFHVFFFSFLLKMRNSITMSPIDMKLHNIWSKLGSRPQIFT